MPYADFQSIQYCLTWKIAIKHIVPVTSHRQVSFETMKLKMKLIWTQNVIPFRMMGIDFICLANFTTIYPIISAWNFQGFVTPVSLNGKKFSPTAIVFWMITSMLQQNKFYTFECVRNFEVQAWGLNTGCQLQSSTQYYILLSCTLKSLKNMDVGILNVKRGAHNTRFLYIALCKVLKRWMLIFWT